MVESVADDAGEGAVGDMPGRGGGFDGGKEEGFNVGWQVHVGQEFLLADRERLAWWKKWRVLWAAGVLARCMVWIMASRLAWGPPVRR